MTPEPLTARERVALQIGMFFLEREELADKVALLDKELQKRDGKSDKDPEELPK
jgi:hypothetical protein